MVSSYVSTLMLYRSINKRTEQEESMATQREIELDRSRKIEQLIEAVKRLETLVTSIEEKLNEQQTSESTKKATKVSSKG